MGRLSWCSATDRGDVKVSNVIDQILPDAVEAVAAVGHLVDRVLLRPALLDDPVDGAHRAGAVGAMFAMEKYRLAFGVGGDFQEIDTLALQRIEVFKGGNGLQFGGTSLGGSINMISKTASSQPGYLFRFEVGSDDTVRTGFQTGQIFDKSDLFLSLSGLKSDEYRDHADQEK